MTTLCTVAEAKTQINKSSTVDDTELSAYVDAVTAPIELYCGEILPATVTNELQRPYGDTLVLNSERVASVTTLTTWNGTSGQVYTGISTPATASAYTYILAPATALIYRSSGVWCGEIVTVTYVAGFAAVPASINLAARMMVADLWETQQGGGGLPPVFEDDTVTADGSPLPRGRRIYELLEPYRRSPRVG